MLSLEDKTLAIKLNYPVGVIAPSHCGELVIMTINQMYLDNASLSVALLGRRFAWLDIGTHESLHQASSFVQSIEAVQGLKIACLEEIAWRNSWLSSDDLIRIASPILNNDYGRYLMSLLPTLDES